MTDKTINSYDIFDTLIARWYKEPDSIFFIIEKLTGIYNFCAIRKQVEAELFNPSLDLIYNKISSITNLSFNEIEKIKNLEILLEHELSLPIVSNINRINDGDILVSDMYLDKEIILSILKKNGLNKKIKLYVSNGGKHNGWIWDKIEEKKLIQNHMGDNYHSDVISANRAGISTIYTTEHRFTTLEEKISKVNKSISLLMRAVRLNNPHKKNTIQHILWNEASSYTLPINILFSYLIYKTFNNKKYNNILFSTRDCYFLHKIFTNIYSNLAEKSLIFHSSRKMYYNPSEEYVSYCKENMKKSLIIDMQGTGLSFKTFCEKNNINNCEYMVLVDTGEKFEQKIGLFESKKFNLSDKIEKINYATYGTLIDFKEREVRADPEYNIKLLKYYEDAIEIGINFLNLNFFIDYVKVEETIKILLQDLEKNIFIDKIINHKDNYQK